MALAGDDRVISMSILDHIDVGIDERDAFLRYDGGLRRQNGDGPPDKARRHRLIDRLEELSSQAADDFVGDHQRLWQAQLGIMNIASPTVAGRGSSISRPPPRNGEVIAAFPVNEHDQIMLVTDQGKVIRIPVDGIRIAGRNTQGVTLFNTDKDEHVVSVARLEGAANIEDTTDTSNDNDNEDRATAAEDDGGEGGSGPTDAP